MKDLKAIFGKEFESKLTGDGYGVFRACAPVLPADFTTAAFGRPFAEDDGGNLFTELPDGNICFWDHETDDLTVIASTWDDFAKSCIPPKPVELKPGQVKSVWVDPEFAKKMGMTVPKDGWIKRKA